MGSKLIEFTNILKKYGWGSRQAKAYRAKHANDEIFENRAEVVELLFRNRKSLEKPVGRRKVLVHARSKKSGLRTDPI
ncbi:MAG: hypothetical protein IH984_06985 [Planctomycetes bacterium]|nr:hypothetical protein [Planctomycetota bacterium]